jgi:hypothetical protein
VRPLRYREGSVRPLVWPFGDRSIWGRDRSEQQLGINRAQARKLLMLIVVWGIGLTFVLAVIAAVMH